jgi:hypothetical protein
MARKLTKQIEGEILTIGFSDETTAQFDLGLLSDDIKVKLAMHGLSQKLGDSAAGDETTQEAKESVQAVWNSILKGEWSTRRPAEPKVTKKSLAENLSALSTEDQEAARALLAKLGVTL